MDDRLAVVIMAAGKGTRMKDPTKAKVMYTIAEKPMIEHVVDLALRLQSSRTVVIVGWQKDAVTGHLAATGKPVVCVEQNPQLGTGHAVMQAERALEGYSGDVLVLSGDVPLLTEATVRSLIVYHRSAPAAATLLTAILVDPTGYGRILRDRDDQSGAPAKAPYTGNVLGIMEHKDASEEQRLIREINTGIYVFDKEQLFAGLKHITPSNVQNEYYLTDVFGYFWRNNLPVRAVPVQKEHEVRGINTLAQLEEARVLFSAGHS
jgi:UDP-N-acetylglucosamine pyrophosphorylase